MTVLYESPVFGPIHSRRLGVSLGINLLPADGKCCSFDCLYCECGFNKDFVGHGGFASPQSVHDKLKEQLELMRKEGPAPDVITFAGNGEPTLNPWFPEIVRDVISLRDEYFPSAKISVLSNATQILRQEVFDALLLVDNNILKLDTVSDDYIRRLDRPVSANYSVRDIIGAMKRFNGHCIVQTMFLAGEYEGKDVTNTSDTFVLPWIEALKEIRPSEVMVYTIDRETPAHGLRKATPVQLDGIARKVEAAGIKCQVSY